MPSQSLIASQQITIDTHKSSLRSLSVHMGLDDNC